jgi:hypothetical protein
MTVLILADRNDHHANAILASVRKRGVDAHIWDTVLFPSAMCVTFYPTNSSGNINIDQTISVKFSEVQYESIPKCHQIQSEPIELILTVALCKTNARILTILKHENDYSQPASNLEFA